ncbi:MAG: adaptor protein MecA [Clostridia bacterium]|nr:adaptor protein MecA [Clostridia bacterium]
MKIEKISSNKIKITVTNEDMTMLGISFESFITDSPERSELFRSLIKRAESETGIVIDNSRVMIEASPHKYDGIVVFFTKLDSETESIPLPRRPKLRAKPKTELPKELVYAFESMEELLEFSERVKIGGDGDLYFFEDKYYLVLPANDETDINIFEYAVLDYDMTKAFLSEHGTLIIENNALKTIDKFFNFGG